MSISYMSAVEPDEQAALLRQPLVQRQLHHSRSNRPGIRNQATPPCKSRELELVFGTSRPSSAIRDKGTPRMRIRATPGLNDDEPQLQPRRSVLCARRGHPGAPMTFSRREVACSKFPTRSSLSPKKSTIFARRRFKLESYYETQDQTRFFPVTLCLCG